MSAERRGYIPRLLPHSYRCGIWLRSLLKSKELHGGVQSQHIIRDFKKLRRVCNEYDIKIEFSVKLKCLAIIPCWSKSVPYVQHDYFSSISQSNLWFVAFSLQLLSSFLKLPIGCEDYEEFPNAIVIITSLHHFDFFDLVLIQTMVIG